MRTPRRYGTVLGLGILVGLPGCLRTAPITARARDFSAKAAPTLVEERGVYELVEATHARRVNLDRIASYDTTSILAPAPATLFAGEADMKARKQVLELLRHYVEALAAVSANERAEKSAAKDKDDKAQGASGVAAEVKKNLPALSSKQKAIVSDADVSAAATAIDVIGALVIEHKRARELPEILAAADGPVKTLCELLRKDIGDPQMGGLRYVLRTDFEAIESSEDAAIRNHPEGYSYPEKRVAIAALYGVLQEQGKADAALVKADEALEDLEKTHAALTRTAHEPSAPGFGALLGELVAEGDELAALEESLAKQSK